MNKGYRWVTTCITTLLLVTVTGIPAFAQFENAGEILRSGQKDANILLKEYLRPAGEGFGPGLNSGWFNTAKTHKPLGFDITVSTGLTFIPSSEQLFDVAELEPQFQEIELVSGGPTSPNVAGDEVAGATIGSVERNPLTGERVFEFQLPEGSGFPYVPSPMIQASVGLIKDTDLTVRFLPELSLPNDLDIDLFGIGVKHRINNWLPGGKRLPVDLSLQGGYTNLSASIPFEVLPEQGADIQNDFPASTWENQGASIDTDAFTINALIGKTLPVLSIYGGVGYQTSSVDIATPGSFPVIVPNENFDPADPSSKPKKIAKVDDPIDITYDNNGSLQALAGFRIRLLILNISGSFTIADNPVGQVSVGIGIR